MYGDKTLQYSIKLFCQILSGLILFSTIIYFCACVFIFFYQPRLIFFPSSQINKTPENFSLTYQDVWLPIESNNGRRKDYIHGWWIENQKSDGKVLLYLHGNSWNISVNINHRAKSYYEQGFSVLLIDYRGYGLSHGPFPSESRVYEDADTAWSYLVAKQGISPNQIFIYGHSLGGAIAIELASRHPQAAGLIVESSFTSIREIIEYRNIFSIFPVNQILRQKFDAISKVSSLKVPVLFIHGALDASIPSYMSKKLYDAAPEPKHLVIIDSAQHSNIGEVAPYQYAESIKYFLKLVKVDSPLS